VLITLAIIGIIAAITIPSIIANHKKRTLETQFAKTYHTLQQAANLAVAEHGDMMSWDWKDSYSEEEQDAFVKKYLTPYLNIVKFCPADNSVTGCFPDIDYLQLDGSLRGNVSASVNPKVVLNDGTIIRFAVASKSTCEIGRCLTIHADVNGHKKPNTFGRDTFIFGFYPQTGEFLPYAVYKDGSFNKETRKFERVPMEEIMTNCSNKGNGWHCAGRIVQEGFKMNY